MKVTSIESRRLHRLIRKEFSRCLVLDCRPYLPFSSSSVQGSINVNLNSVLLRRARGGAAPLHFVVPEEGARCRLRDGQVSVVVVLDERSQRWQKLKKESPAHIVINTLSSLPGGPHCYLWGNNNVFCPAGGYESFRTEYPQCCVDQKSLSQEENDSSQNLLCEKLPSFHKPNYDQGSPVEILPFLYLGSAYHASKCEFLSSLRITALLNVSRKSTGCMKDQYDYKWIPVEDNHTTDISSHFQEAIDFIDTVRLSGGRVLVHCEAGISRSPTICMAYLMKTKRIPLEEAFEYIKQRRSLISPNFSFMGQLLHYESEIFSSKPSGPVMSCKRDTVSFFAEDMNIGQHFEGSCFTFPTSVLTPVPLRSPVHQLKRSPITATSSC
ncbi:PREDICTED: dual specificity protein phosphatase 5 [Nanorana parkeri]|uniref:dual specificity protein phosphatase 5 n=1 Tax=Nanorana parkeri TaxID=125878 RepID=UPI000854FD93|nr:PREDICTED: dual specificity protein phosphatase 5 [Nanorana parkeri]